MPTFIVLTRLTPEAVKVPGELKRLEITASKAVALIRSYGHAHTETWTAIPWERFKPVLPT
jgi:hypothetical protein